MHGRSVRMVVALNLLMFLISLGEGLVTPFLALYAAGLGASYSQLGYLMAGFSITNIPCTLLSGKLSDHFERKLVVMAGTAIIALASTGYFLAQNFMILLLSKSLEGIGRGFFWPAAEALISDLTEEGDRGRFTGYFLASYGGGVALGSLLGGFLIKPLGFKILLVIYPMLAIVAYISFWFLAGRISFKTPNEHKAFQANNLGQDWLPEFKKALPVSFLAFAYGGVLWTAWGLLSRMAELYGFSTTLIGLIFTVLWGVRLVSFLTSGIAAVQFGRGMTLLMGLICCLSASILFTVTSSFPFFLVGVIIAGIGTGWVFANCITEMASRVSLKYRGLGMGLLETANGAGYGLLPVAAGLTGQFFGVRYTFFPITIVTLLAILLTIKVIISTASTLAVRD